MSERFMKNAFRILRSIYYMEDPKKITKKHKKNKVSGDEFVDALLFLKRKGLVDYSKLEIPLEISLTDKGMEFVVNELRIKRQEEFNKIIAFTGAIVALTTIYSFIVKSINLDNHPTAYWIITPIFLILILICLSPLAAFIIKFWWREVLKK